MYEKARAALYLLVVALNTVALTFGWYSTEQGAALVALASAAIGLLAFVNVPFVAHLFRRDPVDED